MQVVNTLSHYFNKNFKTIFMPEVLANCSHLYISTSLKYTITSHNTKHIVFPFTHITDKDPNKVDYRWLHYSQTWHDALKTLPSLSFVSLRARYALTFGNGSSCFIQLYFSFFPFSIYKKIVLIELDINQPHYRACRSISQNLESSYMSIYHTSCYPDLPTIQLKYSLWLCFWYV